MYRTSGRVIGTLLHSLLVLAIASCFPFVLADPLKFTQQANMRTPSNNEAVSSGRNAWRVVIADEWDVLGPFPIHAREQHYLNPAFPLDLTEGVERVGSGARYPSSYADGGSVSWTRAVSDQGHLAVSFPHIRWSSLRASEGWAALQHHSILKTKLIVYPPEEGIKSIVPRVLVSLSQGSFFTVVPSASANVSRSAQFTPRWYAGNIYEMNRAPPQAVTLPTIPSREEPTTYDLFVSGDYEIRLFGDPVATRNSEVPELKITISATIEQLKPTLVLEESHHVAPDSMDGWLFGQALGIGLHATDGWCSIENVSLVDEGVASLGVELLQKIRLAPTQTRILPIRITQTKPISQSHIEIKVIAVSSGPTFAVHARIPIRTLSSWKEDSFQPVRGTYFFANSMPTAFLAIPPVHPNAERILPPVLALHGAGVDVFDLPQWAAALPRQKHSWVMVANGRTAWGLDWHGPSTIEAFASIDALYGVLQSRSAWRLWAIEEHTRVLVIGHSNGGQGTWFVTSRFPDRIVATVPAATYIKSQSYVPLVQSRSAHFIDPFLRAILETALTPDDNDLFMSNLVDTPILAIHGGDDENVPTWHTRELVSILKTWRPSVNVTYHEDPGKPHWYPFLLQRDFVQEFLDTHLQNDWALRNVAQSFTLTVAVPSESGSLHGFRIEALSTPGRLGRLNVRTNGTTLAISATNVKTISIGERSVLESWRDLNLSVDGQDVHVTQGSREAITYIHKVDSQWKVIEDGTIPSRSPSGRLSNILSSSAPLTFVVPSIDSTSALSVATRLTHDLNVYHKLDAEVINASEATDRLQNASLGVGNVVVIGGFDNAFGRQLLLQQQTAFTSIEDHLLLNSKTVNPSSAALFLHPHPHNPDGLVLFMHARTDDALERAARLFPVRTGVAVPDWVIIGKDADRIGAAGVQGAGVWGNGWTWNEALSSF